MSQLLKEPTGFTRTFTVDELQSLDETGDESRVVGEVQMLRTDKGIWVEAELSSEMTCLCSRCVKDFDQPIRVNIREEFLPQFDVITGAKLNGAAKDSSEDFFISKNHMLDLTEAARQYFDMNAPMKPVCTAECRGICVGCGVDLNEDTCRCKDDNIDPRWAALAELAVSSTPDAN